MRIFALCQCTDYARVARVTFAVGEAVWCCSIQAAMAPPHHRPRPPSPSPKNAVDYIYLSRGYLNVSDCVAPIWPVPIWHNNIPCGIPEHDPPCTYVRTYICIL